MQNSDSLCQYFLGLLDELVLKIVVLFVFTDEWIS